MRCLQNNKYTAAFLYSDKSETSAANCNPNDFISSYSLIMLQGERVFTATTLTTTQHKHVISLRHTFKQVAQLEWKLNIFCAGMTCRVKPSQAETAHVYGMALIVQRGKTLSLTTNGGNH